jgi:phage terminase large subunit
LDSKLGAKLDAPYPEYSDDPAGFATHVLGWTPWQKQAEIGKALVEHQRVSVVSCNGAGKTTWAGRLLLWFLFTRPDAIVITTAPTWHQVGLLWREVRSAFLEAKYSLKGELMSTRLDVSPSWYAMGLSTDREERFQGFHARGSKAGGPGGLFVIVDEASGVADHIFDAMRGYLTSPNCYVLLIGNGNRADGAFFESHQRGNWSRFEIAAHDVPEDIISRDWIEEQRQYYGEDSPQYFVRVLGKFPPRGGDYQLIPTWLLEETAEIEPEIERGRHMGLDVARTGSDYTVAVVMVDGRVESVTQWQSDDLMYTAKHAMRIAKQWDVQPKDVHVDMDGLGAGVVDRMREEGWGVDAVDFGSLPKGDWAWLVGQDIKILNRRAELHWIARMGLINKHFSVPTQWRETLWKQLGWTNFEYNEKGMLKMEAKEKIRQRYGASPDHADAFYLCLSRANTMKRIYFI